MDRLEMWDKTSISLSAGCDLFMRYVTRTSALEYEDISAGKSRLIERGEKFGEISLKARQTIANLGQEFVYDGSLILTHGYSRVVLALLKLAASQGKRFQVVCTGMRHSIVDQGNSRQSIELQSKKVEAGHGSTFLQKERNGRSRCESTDLNNRQMDLFISTGKRLKHDKECPGSLGEHSASSWSCRVRIERIYFDLNAEIFAAAEGRPDNTGLEMAKELMGAKIPMMLILDAGVANMMGQIDMVLLGAEGVVESGGVINHIGTYQTALVARSMNKPVYVAAESYKFARLFPLDQMDMSPTPRIVDLAVPAQEENIKIQTSERDYTPPQYLTLLFTDLGILTPSAVSDELIQLYL
ncbi:hypothetical protein AXG93_291s1150 [Marchantia polymorpha subsp. ruderalis]|uniref:Translation initiation factor eIF2B subunit alpha n=1 Tax=Marchantia polymorpha subsp. ruderalis TaxID=1480154 RepID=A0A176VG08_MARPO|nr:hypothetical protein AXG93_291s1150 [Marchantia polymorpha subsp. ruderalis]